MLCPEVSNFPPPKVISFSKQYENLDPIIKTLQMNHFYHSVVITCPDELQTPSTVQEKLLEDSDYYRVSNLSITAFLEATFVEKFVKKGKLYGLSADRDCIIQNCAAITPDGILTLHVFEFIFQTLGLEGTKRPHNFYEVRIDLKNIRNIQKIKWSLSKLEFFDFYLSWEPNEENICPSSIAKYFHDMNVNVSLCSLQVTKLNPNISEVPSLDDVDVDELVEWIGMLSYEVDVNPTETYISTYSQPESDNPLKSNRMSLLIVKGLLTPTILSDVCETLSEYTCLRELDNYWTSMAVQSRDCLWQWNPSSPKMFQSHDSSCNIFFMKSGYKIHSVGQLKYS